MSFIGSFFKSIFRIPTTIAKAYYKVVEFSYSVLSYVTQQKIIPKHFTKNDQKHYEEWILAHKTKIFEISGQHLDDAALPSYMLLNTDVDFPAPREKYHINSAHAHCKVDPDDGKSSLLREFIEKINTVILQHNEQQRNNKQNSWSSRIFGMGADDTKLSPENMILKFLYVHLNQTVSHYADKPHEVDKLNLLIDYIDDLLRLSSVKDDKQQTQFYDLLLKIREYLQEAKITLTLKVDRNELISRLNRLINTTKNVTSDILVFLYNIFNFEQDKSEHLERDIKIALGNASATKINNWLKKVLGLISKGLNIAELTPVSFQKQISEFTELCLSDTDRSQDPLISMLEPLRHQLQSNEHAAQWQCVRDIQAKGLEFSMIQKMLDFLLSRVEAIDLPMICASVEYLQQLITVLSNKSEELSKQLGEVHGWQELLRKYSISRIPRWKTYKANSLKELMKSLDSTLASIVQQSRSCLEKISDIPNIAKTENTDPILNDSKLFELINILDERQDLHGKSGVVVNNKIKSFLEGLRSGAVFVPQLKIILEEYFTMITITEGEYSEHRLDTLNFAIDHAHPASIYYAVLVKIFMRTLEIDLSPSEKTVLISKFKKFLIQNFLLHDEASIDHLFDVLIATKYESLGFQQQNDAFRNLIESYFESYLQHINNFIAAHENFGNEINDGPANKTSSRSDDSLDARLADFIGRAMDKVSAQSEKAQKILTISFKPTEDRHSLLSDIKSNIQANTDLNRIVVDILSLISNVHETYRVFEKNYSIMTQSQSKAVLEKAPVPSKLGVINSASPKLENIKNTIANNRCALERAQLSLQRRSKSALVDLIQEYSRVYSATSDFQMRKHLLYDCFNSRDIIMQYAVISYMQTLIQDETIDEKSLNKLNILVRHLLIDEKNLPQDFACFINQLRITISCLLDHDDHSLKQKLQIHSWQPDLLFSKNITMAVKMRSASIGQQLDTHRSTP